MTPKFGQQTWQSSAVFLKELRLGLPGRGTICGLYGSFWLSLWCTSCEAPWSLERILHTVRIFIPKKFVYTSDKTTKSVERLCIQPTPSSVILPKTFSGSLDLVAVQNSDVWVRLSDGKRCTSDPHWTAAGLRINKGAYQRRGRRAMLRGWVGGSASRINDNEDGAVTHFNNKQNMPLYLVLLLLLRNPVQVEARPKRKRTSKQGSWSDWKLPGVRNRSWILHTVYWRTAWEISCISRFSTQS